MWRQLTALPRLLTSSMSAVKTTSSILRSFSILSHQIPAQNASAMVTRLLQPSQLAVNQERGMKQMGRLKRRCKDCYFVMRQERLYVMCKTGKHKQMAMAKKPRNTWILTDATQSKLRAW